MVSRIGATDGGVTAADAVHRVDTAWGYDLVGPRDALPQVDAFVDPVAYEAWRIEQAIPVQPADVDETTIPQEAFLEQDAVSFSKGCFIGQELVCRIDSRGHVNRFLRRVADIDGDWPPVGAEIVVDGKVVGSLTSVAPAALPTGALGYVRREVEPPTAVELRWDGGSARAIV
jgi:folate-binding protein YgfZ